MATSIEERWRVAAERIWGSRWECEQNQVKPYVRKSRSLAGRGGWCNVTSRCWISLEALLAAGKPNCRNASASSYVAERLLRATIAILVATEMLPRLHTRVLLLNLLVHGVEYVEKLREEYFYHVFHPLFLFLSSGTRSLHEKIVSIQNVLHSLKAMAVGSHSSPSATFYTCRQGCASQK